jgi:hypothetical protein
MRAYIAAHHDDVLLSLPRTLSLRRSRGDVVIVVFSEETSRMTEICQALHGELNIGVRQLGFTEAIRRGVSLRECLRTSRIAPIEDGCLESIKEKLAAELDTIQPSEIVVSLLPVHVDHALTRTAAEGARSSDLLYYEDQPYAAFAPVTLARAVRGMRRCSGELPAASSAPFETWYGRLEPLASRSDLQRILNYWEKAGVNGEALWRAEPHP